MIRARWALTTSTGVTSPDRTRAARLLALWPTSGMRDSVAIVVSASHASSNIVESIARQQMADARLNLALAVAIPAPSAHHCPIQRCGCRAPCATTRSEYIRPPRNATTHVTRQGKRPTSRGEDGSAASDMDNRDRVAIAIEQLAPVGTPPHRDPSARRHLYRHREVAKVRHPCLTATGAVSGIRQPPVVW